MVKGTFYLVLILLFSCNNHEQIKRSEALPYIEKVHNLFLSPVDTILIQDLIEASRLIKQNKKIDSIKLTRSLDTANYTIGERIKMLQAIKELDEEIKLRQVTLDYLNLRDSVYKNEFRRFVQTANIMDDKREDRARNLIVPVLDRLGKAQYKVVMAETQFSITHHLKTGSFNLSE